MNVLAVIPARGGSKGMPGKNLVPIYGIPLLAHTINSALSSAFVQRVVVSTDDKKIASVAETYGAEVVLRPPDISEDDSPSELALLHVLDHLRQIEDFCPDLLVFLQCTSPLTLPEDIDGTIRALVSDEADTSLSVVPFHYFLWKTGPNGNAIGINHDKNIRQMRQERESHYLESGAVYVMRTEGF